jgi:hypothetical protein
MFNTEKRSIRLLPLLVLGAFVALVPLATLSAASEVMTAAAADAAAQRYARDAQQYRALGGVGYKSGLVQRAEQEASKYAALAASLRAPVAPAPRRSPEAQYWASMVERYKRMGGVGYKSGLVQRAEAELRKCEPEPPSATPVKPVESWKWGKPIERFLMQHRQAGQ